MPAPIEARVTNLEALVAGVVTQQGEDRGRVDGNHRRVLDEFGNVHGELAKLREDVTAIRQEAEARHTAVMGALNAILERLPK
ncbi:hypothetical protein [Nocardia cyriacigeorgica]|uniref:hypothetical protein n=1 Tax=Nocardia cyriacigeorgica TaxID=135487 RepID=UPI0024584CFA|nr:hypothetical protein [Nocardia cyriacigeorgica]